MPDPRSLADDLRQRDDAALADLLRRRPDLVHPVPPDITALTARATSGPAVARCLDRLDALHLHVLRTAADLTVDGPARREAILRAALVPLPDDAADACRAALDDLIALALVWGRPTSLRTVVVARELVGSAPVPPWPAPQLEQGAAGDQSAVDAQAALHAREALALVRDLLDDWSVHPPGVLRSGALALRDFGEARIRLHADWARTALTIELAHAARLVADDGEEPAHWVPTDQYDAWVGQDPAEQWHDLVQAWLDLPRLPALADERTHVLGTENDRRAIPVLRRDVLALLAGAAPGATVTAEGIIAVLDHRTPRRTGDLRRLTVEATLREGADLGLLVGGTLSTAGRMVLATRTAATPAERREQARRVTEALAEALPEDVDHVLIQADLTIIAPGPLAASAARSLRLLADVESRGHATVYRVTEASLRRALDAGWDGQAIHALLAELSRTPVPQPLQYLIDDVARRHGAVRVGSALSYVRSDSPETLAAIAADRRFRALGLHRIAETVIVAQAPTSEVIAALRGAGYAPAAETPDGAVIIRRPEDRRVRTPRATAAVASRVPEAALVDAAVRSLRSAERVSGPRGAAVTGPAAGRAPKLSAAATSSALRTAIAESRPVWLGYADTDGGVVETIVDPIRLHAGVLTALDHRTDTVRQFAVSRITGVADTSPA